MWKIVKMFYEVTKIQFLLLNADNIEKIINKLGEPDIKLPKDEKECKDEILRLALESKLPNGVFFTDVTTPMDHNVKMVYNWYSKFKFVVLSVEEFLDGSIRKAITGKE